MYLVHLYGHDITGLDRALGGSRSSTGIASDIVASDARDRAVTRGQTSTRRTVRGS
jgi:hypothetical protein